MQPATEWLLAAVSVLELTHRVSLNRILSILEINSSLPFIAGRVYTFLELTHRVVLNGGVNVEINSPSRSVLNGGVNVELN